MVAVSGMPKGDTAGGAGAGAGVCANVAVPMINVPQTTAAILVVRTGRDIMIPLTQAGSVSLLPHVLGDKLTHSFPGRINLANAATQGHALERIGIQPRQ